MFLDCMHKSDNESVQGDHTSRAAKLSDKTEARKHFDRTIWPWKAGKLCLSMVCKHTCNDQVFNNSKRMEVCSNVSSSKNTSGSGGCVASNAESEEEEEDDHDEDTSEASESD